MGPINSSTLKTSSIIGDVDGDGMLDILLASPGYMSLVQSTGDLGQAGGIKAWNFQGQLLPLSGSTNIPPLLMESSAGTSWLKAAPVTLADVDHNGKLDLIATSIQDRTYLPIGEKSVRKNRSSIYIWELNVPYFPERAPWPTYQVNSEHTGALAKPPHEDQAPIVSGLPDQIVPVGGTFFPIDLDQYVEDPDNTPRELSWKVTGMKDLIVVITNHTALVQTPSASWSGKEQLRFTAIDPTGLTGATLATFEARPGYVPPRAVPDVASTLENTPVEIDVLANDSDPAGHPLSIASFSRAALGKITRTDQGTLLYTPKTYTNGVDTFTYFLSNGNGGMSLGSVTVRIIPVNQAPSANPDYVLLDEDASLDIDVLANDSDPDNDPLTIINFTKPDHGTLTLGPQQTFHYQPATHYRGNDSFTYTVSDPQGLTNQSSVGIIVKPVNHPPIAQSFAFTLNKNSSQNITFAADDPEDTVFTFTVIDNPLHGTLWNYPKVATYYPTNGFFGTDSFTYRANDGKVDGPIATVTFNVLDANNPPTASDQSVVAKLNHPAAIHLSAADLDNDPLTFEILTQPKSGTLTGSGTNYLYQPNTGYLGPDRFTYRAFDGKDDSAVATVNITVTDKNTPPVALDSSVRVLFNSFTNITLQASDLESDLLSFHVLTRPVNGKLPARARSLPISPNVNFIGADRLTFLVNDGEFNSGTGTVSITIDTANHAPLTTNQSLYVVSGVPKAFRLAVLDPDGDLLNCRS